jgi:hypothetical protein
MSLSIPNPVPTSGELRMVRARVTEALTEMRTPVLTGVGAADLVLAALDGLRATMYQRFLSRIGEGRPVGDGPLSRLGTAGSTGAVGSSPAGAGRSLDDAQFAGGEVDEDRGERLDLVLRG